MYETLTAKVKPLGKLSKSGFVKSDTLAFIGRGGVGYSDQAQALTTNYLKYCYTKLGCIFAKAF